MASKGFSRGLKTLRDSIWTSMDPLVQCLAPRLSRTMASEVPLPPGLSKPVASQKFVHRSSLLPVPEVLTTIYSFPTMEPLRFTTYSSSYLHLPLRRDILHRAIIFEGDATRQGTASSKSRFEVHGSHRKVRPQKGTGRARLGTKQSPVIRGGGKSFGPHPRDFSTGLPRKMYDLAWRTALSYRYRKGELIVCEDGMEIESMQRGYIEEIFRQYGWGNPDGRSTVITSDFRNNLFLSLEDSKHGRALMEKQVDVKDLLETGRIIIEQTALDTILHEHQSDLVRVVRKG